MISHLSWSLKISDLRRGRQPEDLSKTTFEALATERTENRKDGKFGDNIHLDRQKRQISFPGSRNSFSSGSDVDARSLRAKIVRKKNHQFPTKAKLIFASPHHYNLDREIPAQSIRVRVQQLDKDVNKARRDHAKNDNSTLQTSQDEVDIHDDST